MKQGGMTMPSTDYDKGDEASAYRQLPSLRPLVLIHQDRLGVKHFHRIAPGEDSVLTAIDRADSVPGLAPIAVGITLADLYARVTFTG